MNGISAHLRMRISPGIAIGMGVRIKTPGEQMTGSDVELTLTQQAVDDMPPYERYWATQCAGKLSSLPVRTWWKRNGARSNRSSERYAGVSL